MNKLILTVARHEVRDFLRDGRFRIAAVCVAALLVAALASGASRMRAEREQITAARQSVRERWEHQGVDNPHNAAHYGTYAFKEPSALSLVDPGIDPFVGTTVFLEAHHQNTGVGATASRATDLLAFTELSGATLLRLFVPLLLIMLTYGAIATERESGLLRQLVSTGNPVHTLVAGKVAGVAVALALIVVPACLAGGVFAVAVTGRSTVLHTTFSALIAALAYLAYYASIIAIILGISARVRSAHRALLTALVIWSGTTLLLPRSLGAVAEAVYPQVTLAEFKQITEEERRNGFSGHDTQDKRLDSVRAKTLTQYGVNRVEELAISFAGVSLMAGEDHAAAVYDRHFGKLWTRFRQQQRLIALGGVIAPVVAVDGISSGLSGSDLNAYARFTAEAEQYRRQFVQQLNREMMLDGKGLDYRLMRDDSFWKDVPDMQYATTPVATVLREQAANIATLLGWLLAITVFLAVSVRKVRVD